MSRIVFRGISELLTLRSAAKNGGRRVREADLDIIRDGAIVAENGKVLWLGTEKDLPSGPTSQEISFGGACVLPAFLECHTHLAFAGDRAEEFEWRMTGATYQEISARGGGIVSTVKATRQCDDVTLRALMQKRADRFLEQGVTTLEVKSGYGLDEATEIKCLKIAGQLHGPRIIRTFLGPHSKPPEFKTVDEYFEHVMNTLLPNVAREKLAERVDIYVEKGFFSDAQAERYFTKAKSLGLAVTAHVEQLSHSGGTAVALTAGALSVDHVVHVNDIEISQIAKSATTAVLLPASDFYLKMSYPPARKLLDQGACVALSTDFNPGTSPTQDLSFVGILGRLEMKMTLPEVISAWTVGAAFALGKADVLGSINIEKSCDFSVLACNWRDLFYSVGYHPIQSVWQAGTKLFEKKF